MFFLESIEAGVRETAGAVERGLAGAREKELAAPETARQDNCNLIKKAPLRPGRGGARCASQQQADDEKAEMWLKQGQKPKKIGKRGGAVSRRESKSRQFSSLPLLPLRPAPACTSPTMPTTANLEQPSTSLLPLVAGISAGVVCLIGIEEIFRLRLQRKKRAWSEDHGKQGGRQDARQLTPEEKKKLRQVPRAKVGVMEAFEAMQSGKEPHL